MSKLENTDNICCTYCNIKMNEILLCKNRSQRYNLNNEMFLQRCQMIVCENCKYCESHFASYQELKNGLRKNRHGKPCPNKDRCEWYLQRLKYDHNKEY